MNKNMGLRYPDQKNHSCFFVTTSFGNHRRLGEIRGVYEALAKSLAFCSAKYDSKIAGYVFMPSHLHLLIFIEGRVLSGFMRDFKKYLAQRAFRELGVFDKNIWEPRFDRVAVETAEVFRIKLEYIHNNPVKAGLVANAESWKWSSVADYFSDKRGPVPIWKSWG